MKKKENSNKGITLIALVITIIVLLILAGVSIAILTGENGVLTKATKAKEQQSHAQVKEAISLAYTEYQMMLSTGSKEEVKPLAKVASREVTKIAQTTSQNKIPGTFMEFLQEKKYINESGVVKTKELLGSKAALGNGSGDKDVYKIEEQEDSYILNYYDENKEILKLWEVKVKQEEDIEDYLQYTLEQASIDPETGTVRYPGNMCLTIFNVREHFLSKIKEEGYDTEDAQVLIVDEKGLEEEVYVPTSDRVSSCELYDEIPYQKGKYVYTAKINLKNGLSKEFEFKITIDKYEIVKTNLEGWFCVCDMEEKKYLPINSIKFSVLNETTEREINFNDIEHLENFSAIADNYFINELAISRKFCRSVFQCNKGQVTGYIFVTSHPE